MALASWLEGSPSPGEVSSLNLRCGGRYRGHNFQSISSWRFLQWSGSTVGWFWSWLLPKFCETVLFMRLPSGFYIVNNIRNQESVGLVGLVTFLDLGSEMTHSNPNSSARWWPQSWDPMLLYLIPCKAHSHLRDLPSEASQMIQWWFSGDKCDTTPAKPAMPHPCVFFVTAGASRSGRYNQWRYPGGESVRSPVFFFHLHLFLWMILGSIQTKEPRRRLLQKQPTELQGLLLASGMMEWEARWWRVETVRVLSFKKARLRVAVARQKGALYLVHLPVLKAGLAD